MKKKYLIGTGIVLVLLAAILLGAGQYMLNYSLRPDNRGRDLAGSWQYMFDTYPYLKSWKDSLQNAGALKDTFIYAPDDVKMHAYYVAAAQPTAKTAVIVHGYTDNAIRMMMIGYMYNKELGFNILLPDLRDTGLSGGDAIQMGWLDRKDVIQWMNTANEIYGDSTRMVVHGISMGAATTMMVSGEPQPGYVKCFVEDCGYTNVWDQFSKELKGDIKGMKFGVPEEYLAEGLDPEVKASFMGVLDTLKELGAEVEFFSIKTMEYMIPAYYIIASAEASSNLERFDGVKYGFRAAEYEGLHDMYKKTRTAGFGEEVKRRIMLGSFVLSSGYYDAYYLKALRTKALIKKEFDQAFGKYDVLLAPASPFTAPKIGESLKDPLAMYLGDIYTVAVNLCGLPGITVPCGKDSKGLPIGIQMIGDCFMEKKILRAAHAYETSRGSFAVPGEGGTR